MNRRQFLTSVGTTSTAAIATGTLPRIAGAAEESVAANPNTSSEGPLLKGTPILYAPSDTGASAVWTVSHPVDYDREGYDYYSRRGREAWHGALVQWGVQAIISGHTHSWAYLPATEDLPYAQVVGGGPSLQGAVLIRGKANSAGLSLVIKDLNGQKLQSALLPPKAT